MSQSTISIEEPILVEEIRAASFLRDAISAFRRNRLAMVGLLFVLLLALLYSVFQGGATRTAGNTISYSDFVHAVEQRQIQDVRISGNTITGNQIKKNRYGILLYNSPKNGGYSQLRNVNEFARNGIADIREFFGAVPSAVQSNGPCSSTIW